MIYAAAAILIYLAAWIRGFESCSDEHRRREACMSHRRAQCEQCLIMDAQLDPEERMILAIDARCDGQEREV
jgi:hypothetical protein